ncbi:MAG: type II toxin-antitoxin system HicB family antitoxin [Anaerovoracaceae bacterium]
MLFVYPAVFHKEDGSFWVDFPDLPGCQTYGDTLNETIESAQEALSGYVLTLLEENTNLPAPSDINNIDHDSNAFVSLILSDIDQYKDVKAVKKTLTIPAWLNERAISMGVNFSKTLQDALLSKVQTK